jgi:hypothetical protein
MKYLDALAILLIMSLVATSMSSAATEAQFDAAHAAFTRADGGDAKAVAQAVTILTDLVKAEPDNPLLLVQLGAVTAMQARSTMLPWKKKSFAEKGMSLQDKALAALTIRHDSEMQDGVPLALRVRYIAANTFLAMPNFFGRKEPGEKLLRGVIESTLLETASVEFRGHVWMRAAQYAEQAQRMNEAKAFLNLVISSAAPQAPQAKRELDRIGA